MNGQRLAYLEALGIDVWLPRGQAPVTAAPARVRERSRPAAPSATVPVARAPAADVADCGWDELAAQVAGCRACGLCESRTQTVFGTGDREASWLIIGEAPGAEEDRRGEPFVGRAGKLLDSMLMAAGYPREKVYIANILKCRPPGNRDPQAEEVLKCTPYLERQIALLRPDLIIAVGRIAAQRLLDTGAPLGKLRGRLHRYGGDNPVPVVVTYHPAFLLRSPAQKRKAWEDLVFARGVGAEAAR